MTLDDMLDDSITLQGRIIVTSWWDNEKHTLYDGDGESLPDEYGKPFMGWDVTFIFPSKLDEDTIFIELERKLV